MPWNPNLIKHTKKIEKFLKFMARLILEFTKLEYKGSLKLKIFTRISKNLSKHYHKVFYNKTETDSFKTGNRKKTHTRKSEIQMIERDMLKIFFRELVECIGK